MQHGELGFLTFGLVLLTAAVLSVPIARRLGLSAIVAYLIAGIVIGPHGLAAFGTPESIIPVSELGVVMLLFLIGLELELGRLVALRRAIFGLGAAQLALTALAIGVLAYLVGLVDWRGAVVAGVALAMSATAIALEILEERGQLQQDYGQRAFAILLFRTWRLCHCWRNCRCSHKRAGARTPISVTDCARWPSSSALSC